VSFGVERGKEPIRGKVDFEENKVDIRVTPEGLIKAAGLIKEALKKPENFDEMVEITKENLKIIVNRDYSQEEKPAKKMASDFFNLLKIEKKKQD